MSDKKIDQDLEVHEEILDLLEDDEKILWKKCKNIDYYSDLIKYFRTWLKRSLMIGIGCIWLIAFFPLILVIIFLIILGICSSANLIQTIKEIKKSKKLLSKNELKNYKCCSVRTNRRFIHKDFKNFDKKYLSKLPLIISEQIKDIIVIDIKDIKMIGAIPVDDSYEIYIYCKIVDFRYLRSLYFQLSKGELIEAIKSLHDVLHFKQEEHEIEGGIIYLRTQQTIPQKTSKIFKSEKNNMPFLSDIIKTR